MVYNPNEMVDVDCQVCGKKIKIRKNAVMYGIMCNDCINKSKTYEV